MSPKRTIALVVVLVAAGFAGTQARRARAAPQDSDSALKNQRCATRLSIALLGKSPDAGLLGGAPSAAAVDAMLASDAFYDRFASYVNAEVNGTPATSALQDPVYYLARYILSGKRPWRDLFVGAYGVRTSPDGLTLDVVPNPDGLGYFRTLPWMQRYAGNEVEGIRLSAAYRMLRDTTGFEMPATVGKPEDDRSVQARKGGACKGCHYEAWFALDKAAAVLSRRKLAPDGSITFDESKIVPTQLLGKTLASDRDLVTALVDSDAWKFAQCRMVFGFLYGRPENRCEAPVFDACAANLERFGTINAAVAAVVNHPSFCQ